MYGIILHHHVHMLMFRKNPKRTINQKLSSLLKRRARSSISCRLRRNTFDRAFECLTLTQKISHIHAFSLFNAMNFLHLQVNLPNDLFVYFAFNVSNTPDCLRFAFVCVNPILRNCSILSFSRIPFVSWVQTLKALLTGIYWICQCVNILNE